MINENRWQFGYLFKLGLHETLLIVYSESYTRNSLREMFELIDNDR